MKYRYYLISDTGKFVPRPLHEINPIFDTVIAYAPSQKAIICEMLSPIKEINDLPETHRLVTEEEVENVWLNKQRGKKINLYSFRAIDIFELQIRGRFVLKTNDADQLRDFYAIKAGEVTFYLKCEGLDGMDILFFTPT